MLAFGGVLGGGALVGATAMAEDERPSGTAAPAKVQSFAVPGAPVPPKERKAVGEPAGLRTPEGALREVVRRSKALRERSRTAHRDATRSQAWGLLRKGSGHILDAQPGPPEGIDVQRVISPFAAQVEMPNRPGEPPVLGVYRSSVPFATGPEQRVTNGEPASGRLADSRLRRRDDGRLVPHRAVAGVSLPSTAAGEVRLSKAGVGISLGLAGRSAAEPSAADAQIEDATAFYGEVAPFVDLAVKVTPTTAETFHQLRSPDAPETLDLPLTLPEGARLRVLTTAQREAEDGDVAAVVERPAEPIEKGEPGDPKPVERLVTISNPVAADADGVGVEASYERVGESTLRIVVEHRGRDLAYPIQVDPSFGQDYDIVGAGGEFGGFRTWEPRKGQGFYSLVAGQHGGRYGLHILSNQVLSGDVYGDFPGYIWPGQAEPISSTQLHAEGGYVTGFNAFKVDYGSYPDNTGYAGPYDPRLVAGILNAHPTIPYENGGGNWATHTYKNPSGSGPPLAGPLNTSARQYAAYYSFATAWLANGTPDPQVGNPGNAATFRLFRTSLLGYQLYTGYTRLGWYGILGSDRGWPRWISQFQDTEWLDRQAAPPVLVRGGDHGWGVSGFALHDANFQPVRSVNVDCQSASWDPCPWDTGDTGRYATYMPLANLPAGKHPYTALVYDSNGYLFGQDWTVRLDEDKPTAERDPGQITNGNPDAVRPGGPDVNRRTINIKTADATSGVKTVSAKVDGQPVAVPQPSPCDKNACANTFIAKIPAGDLNTGTHKVEVTVRDQVASGDPVVAARHTVTETFDVTVLNETKGPPRDVEPGLGFEDWMTYDSTDTGAGSSFRTNLATGNGIWSVTPVQNPGIGFNTVLRLSYNSLEPSGLLPGLLGENGALGYGVAGRGVSVQLGSITRLNEPLWIEGLLGAPLTVAANADDASRIVLTDGDGTRHVFDRDTQAPGVRFKKPAGVQVELRRFSTDVNSPRFWAATRPDGSTFFFWRDGRASESEDRHGNVLKLVYEQRPDFAMQPLRPGCGFALVCQYRVKEVVDAAGNNPTGLVGVPQNAVDAAADRKWTLTYDGSDRLIEVRDRKRIGAGRRITKLTYASNRLTSVTVAENAPVAAQKRTWQLGWLSDTGYLNQVTDPRGNATKITYSDPPAGPVPILDPLLKPLLGWLGLAKDLRSVTGVEDRASTAGAKRERLYRYVAPTQTTVNGQPVTSRDAWVRSARKVSSRFTMDGAGRLLRVVDDLDDPQRDDDSPAGTTHGELGSTQTWNTTVNAPASVTDGLKGAGTPDTTEAVTTEYSWGPLGQLKSETEHKGTVGSNPGGDDSRTRSWKYFSHTGPSSLRGDSDYADPAGGADDERGWVYDTEREVDRRGKATIYHYAGSDDRGDVERAEQPGGAEQRFTYDARGLLTARSSRLWDGDQPDWAKDEDPDPGVDDGEPDLVTEQFQSFDGNGDAATRIDPRSKTWRTVYDEVGNVSQVGDPRAGAFVVVPGAEQALASSADPVGALGPDPATNTTRLDARRLGERYVARFSYDALDRQVAQAIPKRSNVLEKDEGGQLVPVKDRFRISATTYDPNDNETATLDPEGHDSRQAFTATDQVESQSSPQAQHHAEPSGSDPDSWALGSARRAITRYGYDADDNLIVRKEPVPSGDQAIDIAGRRSQWTIDRLGRATVQVREGKDGSAAERQTTSRAYDRRDNVIGEVDARSNGDDAPSVAATNAANAGLDKRRFSYQYDAFDRPVVKTENPRTANPSGATDVNLVTRWKYDPEDHELQTWTPAGRQTKREYDDRGDLVGIEQPFDHQPPATSPGGGEPATATTIWAKTTIHRRRDGQPTEIISPRGNDTDDPGYGSNAFRTRFKYYPTGEIHRRWIPKVAGQYGDEWRISYGIDDVGDPTSVRDARGNVFTNEFLDTGEPSKTTRPSWWFYDQDKGQLRERTPDDPKPSDGADGKDGLPSGPGSGDFGKLDPQKLPDFLPLKGETGFGYDDNLKLNRVSGQNDVGGGDLITQELTRDTLGRLAQWKMPLRVETDDPFPDFPGQKLPRDILLEWQYDVRGNARAYRSNRRAEDGGSGLTTWRYDGFDRLESMTEPASCQGTGCVAPTTTQKWNRNDTLQEMTLPSAANTVPGGQGTSTGQRSFEYDAADRRTATVDEAGARTEERYDQDGLEIKRYAPRAFTGGGAPDEAFASEWRRDGAGRITRERRQVTDDGSTADLITDTTYDREGNPTKVEAPGARPASGTGAVPRRETESLYDARGLPWKTTVGTGSERSTTITEFDGARNPRRTVKPKGVTGHGSGAEPTKDDEGGTGLSGFSAWNAEVQRYDEDGLIIGRVLPWNDDDGAPGSNDAHRWRQDYDRSPRGLVNRITGVYDDKTGPGNSTHETLIDRNLAGWPIHSRENRRTNSGDWVQATDPLKYEYDEHGNQVLWSSVGGSRTIQRSFYRSGQLRTKCGTRAGAGGQEQSYSYRYDSSGGLIEVIDWMHFERPTTGEACKPGEQDDKPQGTLDPRRTSVRRDKAGRPLSVNELWGTGRDTRFTYVDNTPNLIRSVQTDGRYPGGTDYDDGTSTTYSYDEQDRGTKVEVRNSGELTGAVDRTTDMRWWPSGERRETKKAAVSGGNRTVEERFYDSQGRLVKRDVDPASTSSPVKTHVYEYDQHGNRTKDERSTTSEYNARDQLTLWTRKRQEGGDPSKRDPAKTVEYQEVDGAGRPVRVKETIETPQSGVGTITTTINTHNVYSGDQLERSERTTLAKPPSGANAVQTASAQTDCFDYNAFGSQTQAYRQTDNAQASAPGQDVTIPTPTSTCKNGSEWRGELETRQVFDTFERLTAGRQRTHGKVDGSDAGTLDGTQAFCYDGFDRRDRRLEGLSGAADPGDAGSEGEGRTRAQTACRTADNALPGDAHAFDYSYLGLTEQLTREKRDGKEQTYEYTASGERLGRLKKTGSGSSEERQWRSYDTDAQGTVVGLESPSSGEVGDTDRYETDPFGAPVASDKDPTVLSTDAQDNPFRFQGFYKDQETGTYDMQARAYRPELGRFLQQDRFEDPQADLTLAADPLTSSRYAFTAGNPGTRAEYDGHTYGCSPVAELNNACALAKNSKDGDSGKTTPSTPTGSPSLDAGLNAVITTLRRVVPPANANAAAGGSGRRPGPADIGEVCKNAEPGAAYFRCAQTLGNPEKMRQLDAAGGQFGNHSEGSLAREAATTGAEGLLTIGLGLATDGLASAATRPLAGLSARLLGSQTGQATSRALRSQANKLLGRRGDVVVLGRQADTAVAKNWSGHVVLDTPEWSIELNDAFISGAIRQRRQIYLASPVRGNMVQTTGRFAGQPSVYARELNQLKRAGYVRRGDYMEPGR